MILTLGRPVKLHAKTLACELGMFTCDGRASLPTAGEASNKRKKRLVIS